MTQRPNPISSTHLRIGAVAGVIVVIFLAGWTVSTLSGPNPSPSSGFGLVSQSPGSSGSLIPGGSGPGDSVPGDSVPGDSLAPSGSPGSSPSAGRTPAPGRTPVPTTRPGPTPIPTPQPKPVNSIKLGAAISGFSNAIFATGAHDGTNRIFVVQQTGQIVILRSGGSPLMFLNISGLIKYGGEQGLLGLAFHPGFRTNGRFYVYYNQAGSGNIMVAQYTASGNVANPASARPVIAAIDHTAFTNHNGGMLNFGPDGLLYFGTGDGGSGGNPTGTAQNLGSLLGKILRINVNGTLPGKPAIWAYGVRNPWRWSFDSATGDIWIGDVGQDRYEEIDHVSRAAVVGRTIINFGWNRWEGRACFKPASGCSARGITMPVAVYDHSFGCAIVGGYVYRGPVAALRGNYFYGDYCSGRIWRLVAKPGSQAPAQVIDTALNITAFAQDDAGNLYVVSAGSLYRIGP